MTLIFARGRRFLPAIFLLILTLGIGLRAFAQGNEWRVFIMGGLSKEEAEAKVKAPEISGMGDVVVLPYQNSFGLFIGSFATSDEANKKLEELRGEGWLVQSVVQPGGGAAPAPTLEMATPAPAIPTAGSSAPANAGAPPANSTGGAVVYRLEAAVLPDLEAANKRRNELVNNSGVYPVEVLSDGGGFHVYVSYPATSREEADREAANFRRDFPELNIKVVEIAGAPSTDAATLTNIAGGATAEEINYLRDLQSKAEGGRTGRVGQDEARRAEEALKNLDARRQEILAEFARQRERELDAMRRQTEIRRFAIDNNFQAADAALLQWRQADPSNAAIQFMQEWLETRKSAAAVGGGGTPPELQTLIENAEKAQIAGKTQEALELWQQVRRTAKDDATVRRAVDQIDILTGQLSRTVVAPKVAQETSGSPMMMYVLIGVGVLVVVGIIIVLQMKKKSAPPSASASMRAAGMMTTPLPVSGGMMSAMHGVKQDSKSAPRFASQSGVQRLPARDKPTNPRPSGEVSRPAAAELARQEAKAPAAPVHEAAHPASTPPPAEEPILSSSVNLGNLVLQEEAPAAAENSPAAASDKHAAPPAVVAPSAPAAPAAAAPPTDEDLNSAQTIRMPGVVPPAVPAAVAPASAPLPPKRPPQIPVGISAPTPPPVATPSNTYYEQKFEDEEIGAMPRGWKGNYDYATLEVVEREGGGKCMKFEKGKGTGSAYFSCRFPDAAGRVVVEFNLRCDHKNKYLLGFYVEMDEDFRHSVHTVVHMDATKADKVSLRLQNETAPYKLGEWSRIRYLIDLPRNMVDGFVDDKPVAIGVRLPSRPRVVNTLSIRDNLATEGILMIDNIRIYKDRG